MSMLAAALRSAFRGMAARPGFAALMTLTLALGIGANTAVFSVADATLRRGLPYPDPDRLVSLFETRDRKDFEQMEASYPNYRDFTAATADTLDLAGYTGRMMTLGIDGTTEMVRAGMATGNLFRVLGARPAAGRLLEPSDERPVATRSVVLSHAVFRARFGGAAATAIGRKLIIDGEPAIVVGVLAADFAFAPADDPDYWIAMRPTGGPLERRNLHWVNMVARVAPGVTAEQAQAAATTVAGRLAREYPDSNEQGGLLVAPLADQILGKVRPIVVLLLCGVGLVLLIACANAANLLLAHHTGRARELAVRSALGADRWELVALLTVEAVVYALAGGALGVLLAMWGLDVLIGAVPDSVLRTMPFLATSRIDTVALVVTFSVALATGLGVGTLTALRAAQPDLNDLLKSQGRSSTDARRSRLRDALVVGEVALAFVLLAGAGLVARSLLAVLSVDPGFDASQLATAQLRLPDAYDEARAIAVHDQIIVGLSALPGARGAATVNRLPLSNNEITIRFVVAGKPPPAGTLEPEANIRRVSANYFDTMSLPVLEGRAFGPADRSDSEDVVIVNRTLAARHYPDGAVGKALVFTHAPTERPRRIVGVVGDEQMGPLDGTSRPAVYTTYAQEPAGVMSLAVRGRVSRTEIERAVHAIDPAIGVFQHETMDERVAGAPWMFVRRFPALLVGVLAALALVLTSIGIYGVVSYTIRLRTHEIGIRRAVGARDVHIAELVLRRAASLTGIGLAIGAAGALIAARLLSNLLYGVAAWDPATYVAVGGGLFAIALLASWLPARAALRVEPLEALRTE